MTATLKTTAETHGAAARPTGPAASRRTPARRVVAMIGRGDETLSEARLDDLLHLQCFEEDWTAVERLRRTVEARGLSRRVAVHHITALALVDLTTFDAVADARSRGKTG